MDLVGFWYQSVQSSSFPSPHIQLFAFLWVNKVEIEGGGNEGEKKIELNKAWVSEKGCALIRTGYHFAA